MNNGASETLAILRASLSQSLSLIMPERMLCKETPASADNRRMTISLRPISNEKNADVSP